MLLGRVVTNTIAGGIADPRIFARQPEIYAWGMVSPLTRWASGHSMGGATALAAAHPFGPKRHAVKTLEQAEACMGGAARAVHLCMAA